VSKRKQRYACGEQYTNHKITKPGA